MRRLPTGVTNLDRATAGGVPGALWVMSGPPGTPASPLALTAARATAVIAKDSVLWLSSHEHPESLMESAVCAQAPHQHGMTLDAWVDEMEIRAYGTEAGKPDNIDAYLAGMRAQREAKIDAARATLHQADIGFSRVEPAELVDHAVCRLGEDDPPDLLVLDRVDPLEADHLVRLRQSQTAARTWTIVVTDSVTDEPTDHLLGLVDDSADLLIWILHPDLHEPEHPRCGEADLGVYRPGRRMVWELAAHQPHFRRYSNVWRHPTYEGFSVKQQQDGPDWSALTPYE
jgi:hypothetical protein